MSLHVLNLDDNDAARYARSRGLRHAGFEVLDASTGEEALLLAGTNPVDVAVVDVRLPDMSGIEVTRRIKSDPRTRSTRVVQVSAVCLGDDDEISSLRNGADIYLRCPLEPGTLSVVIDTLAKLRRAPAGDVVGVVQFDLSGYVTSANQGFCDLVQRNMRQLCVLTLAEIVVAEDADGVVAAFNQMVRGDSGDYRAEVRLVRAHGPSLWAEVSFSLVRSVSGVVRGAVATVVDRKIS